MQCSALFVPILMNGGVREDPDMENMYYIITIVTFEFKGILFFATSCS